VLLPCVHLPQWDLHHELRRLSSLLLQEVRPTL
jgi:hypothetical protein